MRFRLVRVLVSVVVLVAGCDRWLPPPPPDPSAECDDDDEPIWSWPLLVEPAGNSSAVVERDGQLFLAATGGMFDLAGESFGADGSSHLVAALSTTDGSVQWTRETDVPDHSTAHGIAVSPTGALFSVDGSDFAFTLRRLDPIDGDEVWATETDDEPPTAIAASTSIVVTASVDDRLAAYDSETGALVWSNQMTQLTRGIVSLAFTRDGDVAAAQDWADGVPRSSLWVFSAATGDLLWSHGDLSLGVKVATADDGDIFLVTHSDGDHDVRAEVARFAPDGAVRWARSLRTTSRPIAMKVAGEDLVIVGNAGRFDGTYVDQDADCRYVAHLSAATGEDVSLFAYCYCTRPGTDMGHVADVDDTGRLFVRTMDLYHGIIAAFDPR